MSARKLPPDLEVIRLVFNEGRSLQSVADEFGSSRQAVSACLRSAGRQAPNSVQPYRDWIPWRVRVPHNNDKIVRKLRRYARWQMGERFTPGEIASLNRWVDRMHRLGVVVDYHPDIGFVYVPAAPDERGELIRRPE
jgi:hypothetical protein